MVTMKCMKYRFISYLKHKLTNTDQLNYSVCKSLCKMMQRKNLSMRSHCEGGVDWKSRPRHCHSLPAGCCHCVMVHHAANVSPVSQPLSASSSLGVPAVIHRQSSSHLTAGGSKGRRGVAGGQRKSKRERERDR